jgi:lipid-A-disaccharide synthase
LAAARVIRQDVPTSQFVVARAPHLDDALFADVTEGFPGTVVVRGETDAVLAGADVAVTASGTATVQAALHDTPMVVVYRLSPWTYRLGRRLVKVDTFGMVNLIAGERIVPELIQDDLEPSAVARHVLAILNDPGRAAAIRAGLARVRERLGGSGASRRAAEAVLRVASSR